jgi:hypothetical protein
MQGNRVAKVFKARQKNYGQQYNSHSFFNKKKGTGANKRGNKSVREQDGQQADIGKCGRVYIGRKAGNQVNGYEYGTDCQPAYLQKFFHVLKSCSLAFLRKSFSSSVNKWYPFWFILSSSSSTFCCVITDVF